MTRLLNIKRSVKASNNTLFTTECDKINERKQSNA